MRSIQQKHERHVHDDVMQMTSRGNSLLLVGATACRQSSFVVFVVKFHYTNFPETCRGLSVKFV